MKVDLGTLPCRHEGIIGQVGVRYSQLCSLAVDRCAYFGRLGTLGALIVRSKWVYKNHFFIYFFAGTTVSSAQFLASAYKRLSITFSAVKMVDLA